jgi:hypothetical protein
MGDIPASRPVSNGAFVLWAASIEYPQPSFLHSINQIVLLSRAAAVSRRYPIRYSPDLSQIVKEYIRRTKHVHFAAEIVT